MGYSHYCPDLSPNSKKPNMLAESCAEKIKLRIGKCAKCTSRVGYVAPVKKKSTFVRWRRPVTPKRTKIRMCVCGKSALKKGKHKCEACVAEKRVQSQADYRRKQTVKKIERYTKLLEKYQKRLRDELL